MSFEETGTLLGSDKPIVIMEGKEIHRKIHIRNVDKGAMAKG